MQKEHKNIQIMAKALSSQNGDGGTTKKKQDEIWYDMCNNSNYQRIIKILKNIYYFSIILFTYKNI